MKPKGTRTESPLTKLKPGLKGKVRGKTMAMKEGEVSTDKGQKTSKNMPGHSGKHGASPVKHARKGLSQVSAPQKSKRKALRY